MRSRMIKWLARSAVATLVAGVMLAVGPQYAVANYCDAPEQPGLCPPFTHSTCWYWCVENDYEDGGMCVGGEQNGCCTCFMR
jgi:hypothetical protein